MEAIRLIKKGGILLLAKKLEMIPEIKTDLDRLIANNYRISSKLYGIVLNEANEK